MLHYRLASLCSGSLCLLATAMFWAKASLGQGGSAKAPSPTPWPDPAPQTSGPQATTMGPTCVKALSPTWADRETPPTVGEGFYRGSVCTTTKCGMENFN